MTVYVYRAGHVVPKPIAAQHDRAGASGSFPTPMLSPRFESFESPVSGRDITSWSDRDRDMASVGAVDPRDLPRQPFEKRESDNAARQQQSDEPERGN